MRRASPFRAAALAATAVLITGLSGPVAAQTSAVAVSQRGPAREPARTSLAGDYLAARAASVGRDSASASAYYRAALKADPKNPELLEFAFYAVLSDGDIDEAVKIGERLLQADRNARNPNVRLVLGVRSLKQKQFAQARTQLQQAVRGPVSDLIATLLAAWAYQGSGDTKGGIDMIDRLSGPDWYGIFKDLHAGLIYDLAGNKKEAGKRFERAYKLDSSALRVVQAWGGWLSRNGQRDEALKVFQGFDAALPRHPLIRNSIAALEKGEQLPKLVDSPNVGAAEALYGLGAALARREEELSLANRGLAYLQLALYLDQSNALALLSLADLYEAMKKPELAISVYSRVPTDSPLRRNSDIQMSLNLDSLDRTDEARAQLGKLITAHADDLEAILALGNILRDRKKYEECADVYGKAIDLVKNPGRPNWTIYYFRGICYERSKQWAKAEADLKKALELYPEQPHVLNYLGYSWIDQHVNLDEGMRLIRKAVDQRPDDGYIVDSLGWAYYRIGNYDEAIKHLERAVELKPMDPTINDHLGDAYWKIGRQLEAKFQWTHARDLKPEPDELGKIEQKLKTGMAEEPATAADAEKPKPAGNNGG